MKELFKRALLLAFIVILALALCGCTPRYEGVWRHAVAPGSWETLVLHKNGNFEWIHCWGETDAGKYHGERRNGGQGIFLSPYGSTGGWYFECLGEDAFIFSGDVYLKK